MNHDNEPQSRRERIMNSNLELPGDPARAAHEENEDFDAPDTGNFDTRTAGREPGNLERRQIINESDALLEGDPQRAEDDQRVDAEGPDAKKPSP